MFMTTITVYDEPDDEVHEGHGEVEKPDTKVHEGHGEVDGLLPLVGDGQVRYSQVSFLHKII